MSEADSPGAALRAARHAMGASVPEVAGSLKVSWAIIENIEAERFDALPARVFTRAYIRGYADLVGLDPDEMLSAYDQKTAPGETTEIETRPLSALSKVLTAFSSGLLQMPRRQSWVFGGTVILIAVVTGLFLWFFWPPVPSADEVSVESTVPADTSAPVSNDPIEPVPNASIARIETPVSGGESVSVSDGSPDGSPSDPPSVSVSDGSPDGSPSDPPSVSVSDGSPDGSLARPADDPPSVSVLDGSPDGSLARPADDPPSVSVLDGSPDGSLARPADDPPSVSVLDGSPDGSLARPADDPPSVSVLDGSPDGAEDGSVPLSNPLTYVPGDDHVLIFHFTHDCWVQVFDAAGGVLHEDLERAEGGLEVRGDAPFTITLGYAPGVNLEYNGERVMLAQHTHDNVAKLALGL